MPSWTRRLGLYTTIEEDQIPEILDTIRASLEQAFQQAKASHPEKEIHLSLKY